MVELEPEMLVPIQQTHLVYQANCTKCSCFLLARAVVKGLKCVLSCFKMAIFWMPYHTFFVSGTSLLKLASNSNHPHLG